MTLRRPAGGGSRRVLGIDLGERRIGVAVGDPLAKTAAPFATLGRSKTAAADAAALVRLAAEQGAGALIVGLPLDMDGTEGAQATRTREWAEELARLTELPVSLHDERLTSERAERRMGRPPRGRNGGAPTAAQRDAFRARIDREAAALILQDAFDSEAVADGSTNETAAPALPAGLPSADAGHLEAGAGWNADPSSDQHEVENR